MKVNLAGEESPRYTVIYDGDCKVCGRSVTLLTRWDRNHELELVPSQTPGVQAKFPWITPRAYVDSIPVVRARDGKTWQGGAALEELLNVLPKGRLISWLFKIPLMRPLVDKLYMWFARNRYRLGCDEHCAPSGPNTAI
jgi:predicted DCC family thiol-disulfide oxidoreductase YuxK